MTVTANRKAADATTPTNTATGGGPHERHLAGETEIKWQCGVAADDSDAAAGMCDHTPERVELDEPASIDDVGRVHLPGRPMECPECGNEYDFRANGVLVVFP